MKVTYNWLKEFVDIKCSPEELAEKFTLSGSEVEYVGPVPSLFDNVVVGEVITAEKHPNADRLSVCEVNLGESTTVIVCGAPNVAAGQKVVVGLPGATLPNGLTLKKAKIRGISSSGMICSESELGVSDESDGILVLDKSSEVGTQYSPESDEDDTLLDIFINPNRPDCMSVYGLAREAAALTGSKLLKKEVELETVQSDDSLLEVIIKDSEKCPRFCAVVVKGIEVKPSSLKIQQRLSAIGIRPINNIVDITNYCMMEWGYPMHAFDLNEVRGNKIIIDTAKEGEKFTTLDGIERTLSKNTIMVCDEDRKISLGGIMGGENSEIKDDTIDIVFECAYWLPNNILKNAKILGIASEASRRFERGMDPNFCMDNLKYACNMLQDSGDVKIYAPFIDNYPKEINKHSVEMRMSRLEKVVGRSYTNDEVIKVFKSIEVDVTIDGDILTASIPTFRHDLNREIDLIEEVPRVHGLENIEPKNSTNLQLRNVVNPFNKGLKIIRNSFIELGFSEIFTYSFINNKIPSLLGEEKDAYYLKNPISPELGVMRQSLLPGLLQTAEYNVNRGQKDLKLFELGKVFSKSIKIEDTNEEHYVSGLLFGNNEYPSWTHNENPSDFFLLKGHLESFFEKICLDKLEFIPYDISYMDTSCEIRNDGKVVGKLGRYKNRSLNFDIKGEVYIFELKTDILLNSILTEFEYRDFSKYPPAKRELAFVIPNEMSADELLKYIKNNSSELLTEIDVKDVYKGKQIAENERSVSISLTFSSLTKNLQDEEVNSIFTGIIKKVKDKYNIDIRI